MRSMNHRRLGRTDLHVSELGLATAHFGWSVDEQETFSLLDTFRESGGNLLEIPVCCEVREPDRAFAGSSVELIGRWMRARAVGRDELVLVARIVPAPVLSGAGLFACASAIRRACEHTLRRLQVRFVDLLVVEWDEALLLEETSIAAETLVRAGMIRYLAGSRFPAWRTMEWIAHAARRDTCRLEMMEVEIRESHRGQLHEEMLALARCHRVGLVARLLNPAGAGIRGGETNSPGSARPSGIPALALAWALSHPVVNSVLLDGVTSASEIGSAVEATRLDLSFSDIRRLDGSEDRLRDRAFSDSRGAAPCSEASLVNRCPEPFGETTSNHAPR